MCVVLQGTKKIKAFVPINGFEGGRMIYFNAKSFSKMENLKYFCYSGGVIKRSSLFCRKGNIDYLSNELRCLIWCVCPLRSFPSNFHPEKLVMLNISGSDHITRLWDGRKVLQFYIRFYF